MTKKADRVLLAHSPQHAGEAGDPYGRHVDTVRCGTRGRAEAMLEYASSPFPGFLDAIDSAAAFHDLGKLDEDTQAALHRGRGAKLTWDHVDAGVAHLKAIGCPWAAWLVKAHHAPGLPRRALHILPEGRQLRGRRSDEDDRSRHEEQIVRTDRFLSAYVATHETVVTPAPSEIRFGKNGLPIRLALSCLVDADHADTAFADSGKLAEEPPAPRWKERLAKLKAYVEELPKGESPAERERNERRRRFFDACLNSPIEEAMVACEAPVGMGKTTAVTAYLLRRAINDGLRRLIIVAPFTNILSQTADRLREALCLPDEKDPTRVVVEHHHRADFGCREDRDLAALWQAPIVLTTAVSFFETLAGCSPATLRKLHAVPGSAIFIDEAHAALPVRLWRQNFRWLESLAKDWRCRFVFASGSLVRFWDESIGILAPVPAPLPELLPAEQSADVLTSERRRIRYESLGGGAALAVGRLIHEIDERPGPRLVILNTVQNAAIVADAMRLAGHDVRHLSTALAPRDRERVVEEVKRRLRSSDSNWSLVSTSCVEAGVDFSFRVAFRERFSTTSIIQTGGRVNRSGEHDAAGGGVVYDFVLAGSLVTLNRDAATSSEILREYMEADFLNDLDPSTAATAALRREVSRTGGQQHEMHLLVQAEDEYDYPEVARLGKVIVADTRIVVVYEELRDRVARRDDVSFPELLDGSVQIWTDKIEKLGMEPIEGRGELYWWGERYEPDFLGYMRGVLDLEGLKSRGFAIV
jgi:CRISPR-associated endonuclease/helicase Cas3